MNRAWIARCGAAIATTCLAAPLVWAAAPDGLETHKTEAFTSTPLAIHDLDTELVVHNWVLCVSQAVAEELVRAREESVEKARLAYTALSEARSCGRFAELRVILQERLYASSAESGYDARIFGALVHLADQWASAFVVYGGLPED